MLHENELANVTFNHFNHALDDMFSGLKIILQRDLDNTDDNYQDLIAKYPFFRSLTDKDKDVFFILYLADYLFTECNASEDAMIYNIYERFRDVFVTMQFHIIAEPHMQLNYKGYKFRLSCDDIYRDHVEHVEKWIGRTVTFIYNRHEDTEPSLPSMTLKIHSFSISEIREVIEPIFESIDPNLFENVKERTDVYCKIVADMFVYLARGLYDNIVDIIYRTSDPTTDMED